MTDLAQMEATGDPCPCRRCATTGGVRVWDANQLPFCTGGLRRYQALYGELPPDVWTTVRPEGWTPWTPPEEA